MTPLVSIVVPCYRHRPFLDVRLASVFGQTISDTEVILLDDGSSDGSAERLRQEAGRPNVRLALSEKNSGSPFAQWNRGVAMSRGHYVWIAESDDDAKPMFLETLVNTLEGNRSVSVASAGSRRIDEAGNSLGMMTHDAFPNENRWANDFISEGGEEVRRWLYIQNTVPSASAVVFRSKHHRPSRTNLRLTGDWLTWCDLLRRGDYAYVAEALSVSRIHQASQRAASVLTGRLEREAVQVQRQLREWFEIPTDVRSAGAWRYAESLLQGLHAGRIGMSTVELAQFARELARSSPCVAATFVARLPRRLASAAIKRRFT